MAKYMAHLQENTVENILWCSDRQLQTQDLVDCGGCAVQIGDTYADGRFYRDGELIRTDAEIAAEMQEALMILGVSV